MGNEMQQTILVVEDEVKLATLLQDYLTQSGFSVVMMHEGTEVSAWVKANQPDLILLDLMLPGKDGLTICKEVRTFSDIPIIMVTARVEEIDRLLGLELGADDYICKPFSPREVVARVKAVLKRIQPRVSEAEQYPKTDETLLRLDANRYTAVLHGQELALSAIEFHLLSALIKDPGFILSRAQLVDAIYQDHRVVSERTIDSHIKKLRAKMHAIAPDIELIHSVYGLGYKFEMAV